MNIEIVKATRDDLLSIYQCILGIAEYEKMMDQVTCTIDDLEETLFDLHQAEVLLAKNDGDTLGFALYFFNYSTFKGRKGLYLEDLFVYPKYRHHGIGKLLFQNLIQIARLEDCKRMEWVCLDWNQPAIDFYTAIGAKPMSDWTIYRLDEQQLLSFKQISGKTE